MKIFYDAKRLFYNRTGLGNYSRWLVRSYANSFPEDELILLKPGFENSSYQEFLNRPYQTIEYSNYFGWPRIFDLQNKIQDDSVFHGLSAEIPWQWKKRSIKNIVTVHDIIFITRPNDYPWIDRNIYKAKLKYALQQSDHIISISQFTTNEIINHFNISASKITTIYQNCNNIFYKPIQEPLKNQLKNKYKLPNEYWICVSGFSRRKNLLSIPLAYKNIHKKERIPLVFVGDGPEKNNLRRMIKELELENCFIFLENIPTEELPALYQMSKGLFYPSLMEGFGIPVLEAFASGVPVIGQRDSAIAEAGGKAGNFIDTNNSEEFANAIALLQQDSDAYNTLKKNIQAELPRFENNHLMSQLNKIYLD